MSFIAVKMHVNNFQCSVSFSSPTLMKTAQKCKAVRVYRAPTGTEHVPEFRVRSDRCELQDSRFGLEL